VDDPCRGGLPAAPEPLREQAFCAGAALTWWLLRGWRRGGASERRLSGGVTCLPGRVCGAGVMGGCWRWRLRLLGGGCAGGRRTERAGMTACGGGVPAPEGGGCRYGRRPLGGRLCRRADERAALLLGRRRRCGAGVMARVPVRAARLLGGRLCRPAPMVRAAVPAWRRLVGGPMAGGVTALPEAAAVGVPLQERPPAGPARPALPRVALRPDFSGRSCCCCASRVFYPNQALPRARRVST